MPPLPKLLPVDEIEARLRLILPQGTPGREFAIRRNVARTVFAALYIGAVEGAGRWLAPRHVYRMGDAIARQDSPSARLAFYAKPRPAGDDAWYADNSREGVRDEGLRQGLVPLNAVVVNDAVSATSSKGRYALTAAFAALFQPDLAGQALTDLANVWGRTNLSAAARARAAVIQGIGKNSVEIRHPQGGSLVLPGGDSALLTKAAVEVFSKRYLSNPVTAWISDSKVKLFDNPKMVELLDLKIDVARLLPDLIMVDLDPAGRPGKLIIVFIEIVVSDGPIDANRKGKLLDLLQQSRHRYAQSDVAFVTVYKDRSLSPAGTALRRLAWGSFAWFASEPENLVQFHAENTPAIASLLPSP